MDKKLVKAVKSLLEITPKPQNNIHYQLFKVVEEVGEFSQKIFKNQDSKIDLYEEAIDIYLAVIALIAKFDISDELTEEIIRVKMEKWKKNLKNTN